MGLGKTLSMLSAIVGSLGAADAFAKSQCQSHMGGSNIFAKATLVVVPSASKSGDSAVDIRTITIISDHGRMDRRDPKVS